jgi:hypothetical protein
VILIALWWLQKLYFSKYTTKIINEEVKEQCQTEISNRVTTLENDNVIFSAFRKVLENIKIYKMLN